MDGNGVWRFPEGSGRQGRMERYCCSVICGAPMTSKVKGLRWDEPKDCANGSGQFVMCISSTILEPWHDKTNKVTVHPVKTQIRVFTVCTKKAWVLSHTLSTQRWLWSDWVDAKADLSLRWAHTHYVGFVMSWLTYLPMYWCVWMPWPVSR